MNKGPKRVDYSLLSDDLKTLIDLSIKAFPVTYDYIFENKNEFDYLLVIVTNGENAGKIFYWNRDTFVELGHVPGHTHTKAQIVDFAHNHHDDYYTKEEMNTSLYKKSDKEIEIGKTMPQNNNLWYEEID